MNFLVHHTFASTPATSPEEAASRILKMLQLALDKALQEPSQDTESGIKKMSMQLRMIEMGSQMALCAAYQEITGALPPEKYRVEATPELLSVTAKTGR